MDGTKGVERRQAIEVFEPAPGTLYSLDATAHLAGISRRAVLFYCRANVIEAIPRPPFGALYFRDEAIQTIRQMEVLRRRYGINMHGVRVIIDLMQEVERLRDEMRFLKGL